MLYFSNSYILFMVRTFEENNFISMQRFIFTYKVTFIVSTNEKKEEELNESIVYRQHKNRFLKINAFLLLWTKSV